MFGAKGVKSDQIKWNDQIRSDQIGLERIGSDQMNESIFNSNKENKEK